LQTHLEKAVELIKNKRFQYKKPTEWCSSMEQYMETNLDFSYLCNLHKTNPEKFEEVRLQAIENLICSASESSQKRLRGLQFQVDAKRKINQSAPFVACMEISKMMHESFDQLRVHLNKATGKKDVLGHELKEPNQENVVVSFNRAK
jgi:hypothetical protein